MIQQLLQLVYLRENKDPLICETNIAVEISMIILFATFTFISSELFLITQSLVLMAMESLVRATTIALIKPNINRKIQDV